MGILDLFVSEEEAGKPEYMVGRRPLDLPFGAGQALYNLHPGISHEHFIRNDGRKNFGFGKEGEFTEQPSVLGKYDVAQKYGTKRYDAATLEQARQNWHAKNDAMDQIADEMGLWDEGMPRSVYGEYSLGLNNCQDYVRWIIDEYERVKRQGL